jgi:hypothetical protein
MPGRLVNDLGEYMAHGGLVFDKPPLLKAYVRIYKGCPKCGAGADYPCMTPKGSWRITPHADRTKAV